MYIIAGLGNPGKQYENTRHNVGFRAISELAKKYGVTSLKEQKKGLTGTFIKDGEKFMLVEPLTYMNLSGDCIGALSRYYDVAPEHVIVIYDDVDLPLGSIRVRAGGSPGTHNGMKSITAHLGTQNFPRVRIGVGGRKPEEDLADYVLSKFPKSEEGEIDQAACLAGDAAISIALNGVKETMNQYNGLVKEKKKNN